MKSMVIAPIFVAAFFVIQSASDINENVNWRKEIGPVICYSNDDDCEEYKASVEPSGKVIHWITALHLKRLNTVVCILYSNNRLIKQLPHLYFMRLKIKYQEEMLKREEDEIPETPMNSDEDE